MASAAILRKAGWIQRTDPKTANAYYYNTKTGVTQWEQPDLTPKRAHKQRYTPAAYDHVARGRAYSSDPLEIGWTQVLDPNGQPYYYNEHTGATQWERPAPSGTGTAIEATTGAVAASNDALQPKRVGDWVRVPKTCIHPGYWCNERTKETAWVLPGGADQQQQQLRQQHQQQQNETERSIDLARRRSSTFSEGALDAHRTFNLAHRALADQNAARSCLRKAAGSRRRGSITDEEYAAVKRAVASGELAVAGQVLLQASADACAEAPVPSDDEAAAEAEVEAEAEAEAEAAILSERHAALGSSSGHVGANRQDRVSHSLEFYRARGAGSSGAMSRAHGGRAASRGTSARSTAPRQPSTTGSCAHELLSAKAKRLSKLQMVVEGAASHVDAQSSSLAASYGHGPGHRLDALDEEDDGRDRAASALFRRGEMEIMRRSKLVPMWKACVAQLNRKTMQIFKMSEELDEHGERTILKVYETLALSDLQEVVETGGSGSADDEPDKFEIKLQRKRGRSVRLQLPSAAAQGQWAAAVRHNMQLLSPLL